MNKCVAKEREVLYYNRVTAWLAEVGVPTGSAVEDCADRLGSLRDKLPRFFYYKNTLRILLKSFKVRKGEQIMEYTYEQLLEENAILKECIETQRKTIERFINAYIITAPNSFEESEEK